MWRDSTQEMCWDNGIATCKGKKVDSYLTPDRKISSKWITHVNIRANTIKLIGVK